jgi:hypothetical protein
MRKLLALASLLAASGCGSAESPEALIPVNVALGDDLPEFRRYRFFLVDRPDVPEVLVERLGPPLVSFGYLVSGPAGAVTVRGQAIAASGCVVGEGMAATEVVPGQMSRPVLLHLVRTAPVPGCEPGDGGAPPDAVPPASDGPG